MIVTCKIVLGLTLVRGIKGNVRTPGGTTCIRQGYIIIIPKSEVGVRSAAVSESVEKNASLPQVASIFTAELYTISLALTIITSRQEVNSVVYCKF